LLEALSGVLEKADDALDGLFHPVEVGERRVTLDRAVHEDAAEARVLRGVDNLRLADRGDHPLSGGGIGHGLVATKREIFTQRQLGLSAALERAAIEIEYVRLVVHCTPWLQRLSGNRREKLPPAGSFSTRSPQTINIVFRLGRRHGETHSTGARPLYTARRT